MTAQLTGVGVAGVRRKKKGGRVGRVVGAANRKQFWFFRDVDLTVGPGDVVILLGNKPESVTNLMRAAGGLLPVDAGTVSLDPHTVYGSLFGGKAVRDLSVGQSIRMVCALYGYDDTAVNARFDAIAEQAQVRKILHLPIEQTDRDVRQQICHAAALANDPGLIILDRTAYVGGPEFRATCLDRVRAAVDRGSGMIINTSRPEVVHAVGTQFYQVRPKGLVEMTRREAVEALFAAKGKPAPKKKRRKRRTDDDNPDSGLV